jgi:hypothetical protein
MRPAEKRIPRDRRIQTIPEEYGGRRGSFKEATPYMGKARLGEGQGQMWVYVTGLVRIVPWNR